MQLPTSAPIHEQDGKQNARPGVVELILDLAGGGKVVDQALEIHEVLGLVQTHGLRVAGRQEAAHVEDSPDLPGSDPVHRVQEVSSSRLTQSELQNLGAVGVVDSRDALGLKLLSHSKEGRPAERMAKLVLQLV